MHKIFTIAIVPLFCTLLSLDVSAQDERNRIEMTITYKGTTDISKAYSVNYYMSRVPARENDTTQKMASAFDENNFYISVSIDSVSTKLIQMVADETARVNGTILLKDNYTDKLIKEIRFYDAELNNFSENLTTYGYTAGGASSQLTIISPRITINGVELKAKK